MRTKYGAIRTYSELCQRTFDSRLECVRGEELRLLEMAGEIAYLEYQIPFRLCDKPKITYTVDFQYLKNVEWITPNKGERWAAGKKVYEDVKGVLTRETRVKIAWIKEKFGIDVELIKGGKLYGFIS